MASNETRVAPLVMGPLAANATWTGPKTDRLSGEHMFRRVRAEIWAPKAGTLYLDVWDKEDESDKSSTAFAIQATVTNPIPWTELSKRFYRWRIVNGATAQNGILSYEEKAGRPVADVSLTNSSVPDAQSLPVHTTGKKASLQEINASASAAVATGTTNIALVYAPAGKIARVRELGVYINGPAGAASGTHRLLIGLGMTLNGSVTNTSVLDSGPVAYNALIGLYKPAWFSTVAGQFPTDYQGLQKAKEALVFTDTVPLRLIYTNNTDVAQNGNREVRLLCELEAIV